MDHFKMYLAESNATNDMPLEQAPPALVAWN